MFPLPAGVQILLWTNVLVYLLDGQLGPQLIDALALWPMGSEAVGGTGFYPWQVFTYSFLHASEMHIFFNMFGLVMFGGDVERVYGRNRFLFYYFTCVLSAGVLHLFVAWISHSMSPIVGASGGVFGLLLAYAMLFPRRRLALLLLPTVLALGLLYFEPDLIIWLLPPIMALALFFPQSRLAIILLPVAMPAWLLVTLYGVLELYLGLSGSMPDVAHFAHLGGMLGGWLLIRYGQMPKA
jgi:membrane associated rhomboid family serine protease